MATGISSDPICILYVYPDKSWELNIIIRRRCLSLGDFHPRIGIRAILSLDGRHRASDAALGVRRAFGIAWVVRRRRRRRCRPHSRHSTVVSTVERPLGRLRRRLVGVRWSRGRCCVHRGVRNRGRIEDQFLDGHNLLTIAEFLQLAQQRFDLFDESVPLAGFQLPKHFLCDGLATRTAVRSGNIRIT